MKRALIIVSVIIFIGLGIGFFILKSQLSGIFDSLKPTIISELKQKTGVNLQFEDITLAGLLSPHLSIKNFSVDNKQASVKGSEINAAIDLLPLLSGSVQINRVEISKTTVDLKEAQKIPSASEPVSAVRPSEEKSKSGGLNININSLKLTDVSVSKGQHKIEKINLSSNITLEGGTITLSNLKGSLLALGTNNIGFSSSNLAYKGDRISTSGVTITTESGDLLLKGELPLKDKGNINISSSSLNLAPLSKLAGFELLGAIGLDANLEKLPSDGNAKVSLNQIGLKHPKAEISGLTGEVKAIQAGSKTNFELNDVKLDLNSAPISLNGKGEVADFKTPKIEKLDMDVAGGKVSLFGSQQELSVSASRLQIPNLLTLAKSPAKLSGEVTQLTLNKFRAVPDDFNGTGEFLASSLSVPGFNLFGAVIGELKEVPLLKEVLYSSLPAQYQSALSEDSTKIDSLKVNFSGNGQAINLSEINAKSTLFTVIGGGSVVPSKKDGDIELTMILPKDLSEHIVKKLNGGSGLLNSSGSLELSVTIALRAGKPSVKVKTDKLLKGALKEAAGKALDKALSGKKGEKVKNILDGLGF